METRRAPAVGGLVGPLVFLLGWSVLGARTPGYSPVTESISQLAAMDARTRIAMAAAVFAFGIGQVLFARALRSRVEGPAWRAAMVAGLATMAVAGFPLGSPWTDAAHVACVAAAYGATVATPLLAAPRIWPRASRIAGLAGGVLLVASLLSPLTGLFQRAGLTTIHLWIVAISWDMLRTPTPAATAR